MTYSIVAYNQKTKMNEVFFYGLSKRKANNISQQMINTGAKNVKIIAD